MSSNSGLVTAEASAKRKADTEYADEQVPVKKIKSGKTL